jgi:hypothetical protein
MLGRKERRNEYAAAAEVCSARVMGLRFGKQENIVCIVDVDTLGPAGEPLCLAYKTTSYWVAGGVYLKDDGYVLQIRSNRNSYYPLPKQRLEGIPDPLPAYSIPAMEYVLGYSLWWAIAFVILWSVGVKKVRRRRQAAFDARQSATPIDRGPPRLDTKGDRFVYEIVKQGLVPGESIQHQAYAGTWNYGEEREGDDVSFVVLTTARLVVIRTRRGAFGILYENEGVEVIDRADIASAHVDHGNVLFVTTRDGVQRGWVVKSTSALSNQNAFIMNAGRLLSS